MAGLLTILVSARYVRTVAVGRSSEDSWLYAALTLLAAQLGFLAIVYARPGIVAVVLWYAVPFVVLVATAALLLVAFVRSWRTGRAPSGRQFSGYAALLIIVVSIAAFRIYPSAHDDVPSRVRFRVPLDGPVTVAWGGPALSENYHAVMPDQRWAYDLLVTKNGSSFRGAGTRLEDFYAYGLEVVAPADGVVWHVQDDEPDGTIGQRRLLRAFGNHLVVEVAPEEFLFIAHLRQASITVRPGDRVSAGQSIGRVGNSGNSSEPHVHVHLQDRPTLSFGEAIPFYFHGYRLDGREVMRGMPRGGRTVRTRVRTGAFTGDIIEHSQARPSQATRAPRSPSSCLSRATIAYTTSVAPEGPTPATRLCR
jgi:murein DD-endopeptidase MepM/ murein hydrolase activator NlpD